MSSNFTWPLTGTISVVSGSGSAVLRITDRRLEHICIKTPNGNDAYDFRIVSALGFTKVQVAGLTGDNAEERYISMRGNATLQIFNADDGEYEYEVTFENLLG